MNSLSDALSLGDPWCSDLTTQREWSEVSLALLERNDKTASPDALLTALQGWSRSPPTDRASRVAALLTVLVLERVQQNVPPKTVTACFGRDEAPDDRARYAASQLVQLYVESRRTPVGADRFLLLARVAEAVGIRRHVTDPAAAYFDGLLRLRVEPNSRNGKIAEPDHQKALEREREALTCRKRKGGPKVDAQLGHTLVEKARFFFGGRMDKLTLAAGWRIALCGVALGLAIVAAVAARSSLTHLNTLKDLTGPYVEALIRPSATAPPLANPQPKPGTSQEALP